MAIVFTNDEHYGDIADAIRLKNGTQTTYRPDEMADAIEAIPGGLTPTGTIQITQNGNYNVTNYAEAAVAVPGITPAGVKSITADGTYDVTTYASANVNTKPEKGLVFGNYDADGYPHTAEFVGNWTSVPGSFFQAAETGAMVVLSKITNIAVPVGVTSLGQGAFRNRYLESITIPEGVTTILTRALAAENVVSLTIPSSYTAVGVDSLANIEKAQEIKLLGDITTIARYAFEYTGRNSSQCVFDLSNCTSVPVLENANAFYSTANKVFKVPQALLSEWQTATNWIGVTNVTWQGV